LVFFASKTKSFDDLDKKGATISRYEKALALSFVGLEMLDLIGDITYLIFFPHSSLLIVWFLCFSLFIPFTITLLLLMDDGEGIT